MMAQIKKALGVGFIAAFLLAGCGQKGPLYHPEAAPTSEAKVSETTTSEAASAE